MNTIEAVKLGLQGKLIRRKTWPRDEYWKWDETDGAFTAMNGEDHGGQYRSVKFDVLQSEDWEVYDPPLTFPQAIQHVVNGGRIYRQLTPNLHIGIWHRTKELCTWDTSDIPVGKYQLTDDDLQAIDWHKVGA